MRLLNSHHFSGFYTNGYAHFMRLDELRLLGVDTINSLTLFSISTLIKGEPANLFNELIMDIDQEVMDTITPKWRYRKKR